MTLFIWSALLFQASKGHWAFFFMTPERLCWAEDHSVADGWLRCVPEVH